MEVLSAAAYAAAAFLIARAGLPYHHVALAFLVTQAAESTALFLFLAPTLLDTPLRPGRWDAKGKEEVRRRSTIMFQSRVMSMMQTQMAPLLIGTLVGPAGVGIYDALVRLPRFVKAVLSLLVSAVLPVSARLDAGNDRARLRRLGSLGYWLMPAVAFPGLFGCAVYAKGLLEVWVGTVELVRLWPWLSLGFVFPMMNIFLTFGQTLMQVRLSYLGVSNRLLLLQICLQFAVSLAFVHPLGERSFILGQVAAMAAVFPLHIWALSREQEVPASSIWAVLARHAAVAVPLIGLAALLKAGDMASSLPTLAGAFAVWILVHGACIYVFALSGEDRSSLWKIASVALG
jgi:O-antigen/teichoic acid export membrane protein